MTSDFGRALAPPGQRSPALLRRSNRLRHSTQPVSFSKSDRSAPSWRVRERLALARDLPATDRMPARAVAPAATIAALQRPSPSSAARRRR